ncbi:Metallo-beta-lactamase superfamily [Acididesulfobacillus acetoxydans]|uniref:Ribonuclease J n=1 Tax=Acididesulfobacillus acetoxydans TaxID=1561005 RepID=A0A8S0W4M4_9FIRM|nr:ribonuclease J [Acididesulfobacillus acetoxydans]CAA7602518.1 Metallo-beta-lactamase superfamily [Acididesulfobacillus acetoxydans]CEJ06531.1 Ribonuclease J 1 [Acididesulfobacillus acetoxydans]
MPREHKLQIIPLGGLGEIGKNMTVIRYDNQMLLVDAGLAFPEDEMLGIDIVIPDYSYVIENKESLLGILVTHGHEDHIGALPYLLRDLDVPIFATRLTLGLIQSKLKESNLNNIKATVVQPRDVVKLGVFRVEFIRVNHSIPDAVGLAVHTPLGTVIHTGDFKLDHTPVSGETLDIHKFAELGDKGVLCLMSDSTNVERPGFTMSESRVGQTFDEAFRNAKERIILASFASNVHRIQQAITAAYKTNRKVAVVGRSMVNVVTIANELGYLDIPEDTLVDIEEVLSLPGSRACILTTGSQGEPMSALTRMAMNDHRRVEIQPGDTVIISANPIPGNEKSVARTIDHLFKQGAYVIYEAISGMHVSGHGSQEELKLMLNMTRPRYFIPVHGEYRMLIKHAELAEQLGMARENIFVAENGSIVEFTRSGASLGGKVTAGKVLIDGLGVGDVGNIVLRDRKQLSQDGILIVVMTLSRSTGAILAGPDVVTRGFVYVRESESMLEEAKEKVRQTMLRCRENKITEWAILKSQVRDALSRHFYEKTRRRPMILPIIQEIE